MVVYVASSVQSEWLSVLITIRPGLLPGSRVFLYLLDRWSVARTWQACALNERCSRRRCKLSR